jgi:hypothetical protein
VRTAMNGFIICTVSYVSPLTDHALAVAGKIAAAGSEIQGKACRIPSAADYINKIAGMGRIGQKRKTAKC